MERIKLIVNPYSVCVLLIGESICLLFRGTGRIYTLIHSVWLMGVVANSRSLAAVLLEQCYCNRRFSLAYKMHFCKWPPVCNFPVRIGMCAVADVYTFVSLPSPNVPAPRPAAAFIETNVCSIFYVKWASGETFIFIIVLFLSNIPYIAPSISELLGIFRTNV
jgi:hypothetical protein